ncbi:hypothetical protein P167DRAFT_142286 [Morchella conica CCBAS932]|uniref:Uncharacterized protein n=1 Tax=Morchella conica CCBAS932 TaxID=1392247 RepID=A0A3N4KRC3_9PEZI|nr:hypothetical protein P167DRAFT_142286 [Morchella conica CCBAS932]
MGPETLGHAFIRKTAAGVRSSDDYLPRASCMYTASCILLLLFWFPTCLFFSLSPSPNPTLSRIRDDHENVHYRPALACIACTRLLALLLLVYSFLCGPGRPFFFLSFVCLHLLCSPPFALSRVVVFAFLIFYPSFPLLHT